MEFGIAGDVSLPPTPRRVPQSCPSCTAESLTVNVNQPGFMVGKLLGGAAVGAIAGLIPLFFGVRKDKTGLAVGGFLASVAGGMVAGVIPATVLMGIFSYVIIQAKEPAMETAATPGGGASQRSFVAWYIVTSFLVETIFLAVFWSAFMAVSLRRSFVAVLLPSGAAFGLTMGIFFTAFLAFMPARGRCASLFSTRQISWRVSMARPPSSACGTFPVAMEPSFMSRRP